MIDRIIALAAVILAGLYLYGARQVPLLDFGDPIGPRLFPYMITVLMLIGVVVLVLETRKARQAAEPAPQRDEPQPANGRHVGWMIGAVGGWTLLYILCFDNLGYIISTALFLLGLTAYFHRHCWIANILTSVLVPIGTYIVFHRLLNVDLPAGPLAF
jgi:putative tricarboxylic transport membrane protein